MEIGEGAMGSYVNIDKSGNETHYESVEAFNGGDKMESTNPPDPIRWEDVVGWLKAHDVGIEGITKIELVHADVISYAGIRGDSFMWLKVTRFLRDESGRLIVPISESEPTATEQQWVPLKRLPT